MIKASSSPAGLGFLRLVVLVACWWVPSLAEAAASWTIAPRPRWVAPIEPADAPNETTKAGENGQRFLLYQHETKVAGNELDIFTRWSRRITNEAGLQAGSQIDVEFDPTYQKLVLHFVLVRRGSSVIDQLDPKAIKLVQREANLERQVYDGRQSAILFLRDLRIGDVVDYAYTVVGRDPTLSGKHADQLLLGAPLALDRFFVRLVTPSDRHFNVVLRGPASTDSAFHASVTSDHGTTEYLWDLRSTKAYVAEPDAPRWHDAYPIAEVSEFGSWQEVAAWGQRIFRPSKPPNAALLAWVKQALTESHGPGDFILRATRFVQDEVRYVGIEVGMDRRRPADPSATFERRYGDCKDKTALLVAMLRAVDVVAKPALVSTSHGFVIHKQAPSPAAFDHAIVWALSEGTNYWIDPTLSLQGGGADRLKFSPYDQALVLDEQTDHLDRLTRPPADEPSPAIRDHFVFPAPASKDEARLVSERTYHGLMADVLRGALSAQTPEQNTKTYLQPYQTDYPAIHEVAPLERLDDRENNVLRVVAHFGIPNLWSWEEKGRMYAAVVSARSLEWTLPRPSSTTRSSPLAVLFPFRASLVVDVDLPFDLPMTPSTEEAVTPVLTMFFKSAYANRRLNYRYEVVTNALAVIESDMEIHTKTVDKARLQMARSVVYRPDLAGTGDGLGLNWLMVAVAGVVLTISGWVAWLAHGMTKSIANSRTGEGRPAGFGGWLLLLGFNVILSPLLLVAATFRAWRILFDLGKWRAFTTPELTTYRPLLIGVLMFEAVTQLCLTVYSMTVVSTWLKKRRSFPWHFTVLSLSLCAFALVDWILAGLLESGVSIPKEGGSDTMPAIIFAVVWITYLHRSKRVADTFVT